MSNLADNESNECEIVVKSCNLSANYLKDVSELFANENAQDIIMLLVESEMYVNEIALKLELRVSVVVYHLKKLGELGFLTKTEKPISKRTKNHTFYKINIDAFTVILRKKDDDDKEDGKSFLKKIFKDTVKFAGVGIAGVATWFGINMPSDRIETNLSLPIIITAIVIGFGLIMIYFSKKHK